MLFALRGRGFAVTSFHAPSGTTLIKLAVYAWSLKLRIRKN